LQCVGLGDMIWSERRVYANPQQPAAVGGASEEHFDLYAALPGSFCATLGPGFFVACVGGYWQLTFADKPR